MMRDWLMKTYIDLPKLILVFVLGVGPIAYMLWTK